MTTLTDIPRKFIPMYNDFVDAASNLVFKSVNVGIGISQYKSIETLFFEIETDTGIRKSEAEKIFKQFIEKYPQASIDYNIREEPSELEKTLINMSETVLEIHDGFPLTKIGER